MAGLSDGWFSALMRITAGTLATPTTFVEVLALVGDISVPWEHDLTSDDSRSARGGKKYIEGQLHHADEWDAEFVDDVDDASVIAIKAAYDSKAKLKLVLCRNVVSDAPDPDEDYLKGEWYVSGITPTYGPGKTNNIKVKFYQKRDCATPVKVVPT